MITNKKEAKEIAENYNKIKTDKERFKFLMSHSDKIKLVLDNDMTMVNFITEEDNDEIDISLKDLDDYLGNSEGVLNLLEFIGITAEEC